MISIHTPARGVTKSTPGLVHGFDHFNPHSRKGSDPGTQVCRKLPVISIHTPARGVTIKIIFLVLLIRFQSTLPQGE